MAPSPLDLKLSLVNLNVTFGSRMRQLTQILGTFVGCVRLCIVPWIWETDLVIFGAQNLSFGMPGASILHPGGPWDDPGVPRSIRKEILGSRLGFFSILLGFRDPILIAFGRPWIKIHVFCSCWFPGHLFK